MSNCIRTRHVLRLRNWANPQFTYAIFGASVFTWVWGLMAYLATRELVEPIIITTTFVRPWYTNTTYQVIDSNSYLVFISLAIIFSVITICSFRINREELPIE